MQALWFAAASLLCAAINDLVFRRYACGGRRSGLSIAIIGLVWAIFFSALAWQWQRPWNQSSLWWGLLVGLFGTVANILLLEAMARLETAVCSTIYRLNLVPAALMAIVFLHEPVGPVTWIGVALATIAIVAFSSGRLHGSRTGLALVAMASLMRSGMAVAMKIGGTLGAVAEPTLAVAGAVWLMGGVAWDQRRGSNATNDQRLILRRTWGYSLLSGCLTAGVVLFLFFALEQGQAVMVIPLSQMSFVITAVLAWLCLGEPLQGRQIVGLSFALAAVVCLGSMR